jgi:hypothetical protein
MNFSMTPADPVRDDPVLVAGAGLPAPPSRATDPFAELDDLMVVIEALCPVWPERPLMGPMRDMRL